MIKGSFLHQLLTGAMFLLAILHPKGAKAGAQEKHPFTFGGTDQIEARVSPSQLNQDVLLCLMRARWSPSTDEAHDNHMGVDPAFDGMNSFWTEASYGNVSFSKRYL